MKDDEQQQALNIFDVIQGDSYSETISNILDMSQGNEVFKDLLLRGFYQNPKRGIHHRINSLFDKLGNAGKKFNWQCGHDGCNQPSAYSHELSERAVLSYLADDDHKAIVLKRDLKNNSFEFSFDRKHIRDVLNFSGYCSEHDQSLFKLLDQPGREVDLEYVNLQALKMMRRHILNFEICLKASREMASEIHLLISEHSGPELEQDIKILQGYLNDYQQKINNVEGSLNSSRAFYNKIWIGIQSKEYAVDYVKHPCYKLGWVFSHPVELISVKSHECVFSFIFKVDVNNQPVLIHACEKKDLICPIEGFYITSEEIIECILLHKEKLAFSLDFLKSIESIYFDYFFMDEEIYNNVKNPIFILLFKRIFLDETEEG